MSSMCQRLLLGTCILLATASAAGTENPLRRIAASGIEFEGLFQYDANWYDEDLAELDANGNHAHDLRRLELLLKGTGPGQSAWVVGYDAKAEKFLDVNVRLRLGADGRHVLVAGQFKQVNSLEELSSTRSNDFISKATVTNTFAVARRLGLSYGYVGDDWTVSGNWFDRELTRGLATGAGYGMRGTWAPVRGDGRLLHLGLAHAAYDTDANSLRLRARPNADLATVRLIDSGTLVDTDGIATTSLEALWVTGPVKVQAEYYVSEVSRYSPGTPDYSPTGGYVSGVWNLTGETWGYKAGVVSTARPADSRGMWQLGVRYDRLDLDDAGVAGGRQEAWTMGANWYYGSHFKLMLNHVQVETRRRGLSHDPDIWEARAQVSW